MKKINLRSGWIFLTLNALVFVAVIFLLYLQFNRTDNIVYVDSGKLLSGYKGAQEAKKVFDVKAKAWQINLDTLTHEVQNSIMDYEKKLSHMSKNEQTMARQLINVKRRDLSNYQRATKDNADKENAKLMSTVVSRINKFLLDYGKSHGYKMILIASDPGTIAYAQEGLDITGTVIEELNKEFPETAK